MIKRIKELSLETLDEIIASRRHIHKYPEVGFNEFETSKFVAEKLRSLGIEVKEGLGRTGVIGLIKGNKHLDGKEKTIALRADMDALPVEEQVNSEFKSVNKGIMHACGHDAHTAILLGTASVLSKMKNEIDGNIKLIFQPCEEGSTEKVDNSTVGARCLINEGALENPKVDGIFGLHVDPFLPAGIIGYREGAIFAGMATFDILIKGVGGHAAVPHESVDSIVIAAQVVQALQTIASRRINPLEPFVLSIGTIEGGIKRNVIAQSVKMTGTVRSFSKETHEFTASTMKNMIEAITNANGATYDFKYINELYPLVNEPKLTSHIKKCAEEMFGVENVVRAEQTLIGEDFALYANLVPGSFIRLGTGFNDRENYPLHHPLFDIDESAMIKGVEILSYAALTYLQNNLNN